MNIFYTHTDPTIAARNLPDKLVVKMILESAQVLSTAHHILDGASAENSDVLYKPTHKNHPSCVWVRECSNNYLWVYRHFKAMCAEYTERYGKVHMTEKKLLRALSSVPKSIDRVSPMTEVPQCMPEKYRTSDPVSSYREYMQGTKHYAKWGKIPDRRPKWWLTVPSKEDAEINLK